VFWACYVVLANVHVVVTASTEPVFGAMVAAADMATPDGAPIAWMLRKLGHAGQGRVSGPDLTWALLGRCEAERMPVYFFDSSRATLGLLAQRIVVAFPNLDVVGFEAPPFRPITPEEDAEYVERINASGAGLVFVGLGWGTHAVDARWTLKWWRWQYYFVFLAGRNRRVLTDREQRIQRLVMATTLAVFITFSALVGILVLYLVKSALGIDLIPGFSFGVWDWFKEEFLR
jgi:hypothetical protein